MITSDPKAREGGPKAQKNRMQRDAEVVLTACSEDCGSIFVDNLVPAGRALLMRSRSPPPRSGRWVKESSSAR